MENTISFNTKFGWITSTEINGKITKIQFKKCKSKGYLSKNLIKVKILGQLLRMAHHITGRLNYNNLDQCKLTINSINKVNFKAKKTYLLFGQSFERGMKNISDAFESLKSN